MVLEHVTKGTALVVIRGTFFNTHTTQINRLRRSFPSSAVRPALGPEDDEGDRGDELAGVDDTLPCPPLPAEEPVAALCEEI